MKMNEYLRGIAGIFVMGSVVLGHYVNPLFYLFTAFVGINLLQSAFTGWCPMITLLRRLGVQG
jgi:Inner membrane protein YgaP-like, transmembrane domain